MTVTEDFAKLRHGLEMLGSNSLDSALDRIEAAFAALVCKDCEGAGSVRVHGHEDYGVSFECEECETCGGTGAAATGPVEVEDQSIRYVLRQYRLHQMDEAEAVATIQESFAALSGESTNTQEDQ